MRDNCINNKPVISVIMSVYNGEKWVKQAIHSVLSQTFTDFEFIIINDGSLDDSLSIVQDFADRDHRILVINKTNTGLTCSLNIGIAKAQGIWIARIDADDLWAPERLEKQYRFVEENNSVVLLGSGFYLIDPHGQRGKRYLCPSRHANLLHNLTAAKRFFPHSSAFYKADVVKKIGGYRTRFKRAQDRDLWLRLSEIGQIAAIKEPLVCIRQHSDQISHDEKGFRQKIDSRVAIVSYWIRNLGLADPVSNDYNDRDFNLFRDWVSLKLSQNKFREYTEFVQIIKTSFAEPGYSGVFRYRIILLLLKHPSYSLRFLRYRFFGEKILKDLAINWKRDVCLL